MPLEPSNPPAAPILSYAGPSFDPAVPEVFAIGTDYIVLRKGAELPARCLYCNSAEVTQPIRIRLKFVPKSVSENFGGNRMIPIISPILILGKFIESIVLARRTTLRVQLCAVHRRQRFWQFSVWWGMCLAALVCIAGGWEFRSAWTILIGIAILLVPLFVGGLYPWLLKATLIDDQRIVVDGASRAFLDSLPRGG